jgi:hypothetical protein
MLPRRDRPAAHRRDPLVLALRQCAEQGVIQAASASNPRVNLRTNLPRTPVNKPTIPRANRPRRPAKK